MSKALNLVFPLKQSPGAEKGLVDLEEFVRATRPMIYRCLADSKLVHFAHVFIIDRKYLVISVIHSSGIEYLDFFLSSLQQVIAPVIPLIEGLQPNTRFGPEQISALQSFVAPSFGIASGEDGSESLFSAYGDMSPNEILSGLRE